MASVAMSGADTITINNRVLTDLADGDAVVLTFPNDLVNAKTGKNNNALYGLNQTGNQSEVTIKLLRGSEDDKFMNGLFANQKLNFAGFPLMVGNFIKKIGDGMGNIASDTYSLGGGAFKKPVEAKMNVEGDTDQSTSTYTLVFTSFSRTIA